MRSDFGKALTDTVKKYSGDGYDRFAVLFAWRRAAGDKLSKNAVISKIEGKTVFLVCKNSVWCSEIENVYKEELIRRINDTVGAEAVTDIRCTSKGFSRIKKDIYCTPESRRIKNLDKTKIDERDSEMAEKASAAVENDELRNKIKRTLIRYKKADKVKEAEGARRCKGCGALTFDGEYCIFCREKNL
ncbi:MAG: DUF721 domain-containing protein [Abditibacteriota bacterium]|nr:DUF721 domain-containing protein [Abditibacteriota bacterium]